MAKKSYEAVARDWNGREITVTFEVASNDAEKMADAAHAAFHRNGKWTIELLTIDGIKVKAEFRYHK